MTNYWLSLTHVFFLKLKDWNKCYYSKCKEDYFRAWGNLKSKREEESECENGILKSSIDTVPLRDCDKCDESKWEGVESVWSGMLKSSIDTVPLKGTATNVMRASGRVYRISVKRIFCVLELEQNFKSISGPILCSSRGEKEQFVLSRGRSFSPKKGLQWWAHIRLFVTSLPLPLHR
jgi:hypothetical protein